MAEYIPLFPDESFTTQASAAITAGMLVAVSGPGTVAKTAAANTAWVGVAGQDAAASGDKVTVWRGGIQRLTAAGGITAGDQVVAAANGAVAALAAAAAATTADINAARQVVGIALTTAADTASVEVALAR